ncbi:integrator complex subunit 3-like [Pomacea canaliculata]|uniref:integrator complex subunit 3-like n=1 Tax=Pomacea canaliculata TaxID=400727 RepID=UPI000D7262E4|nr:integrator complex subunit 3-like [Pomacea canaliculata]
MDQNSKDRGPPPKIFTASVLEQKDEIEERLEKCNFIYMNIIKGLSDREANDTLIAYSSKGNQHHDEIQMGMLYTILTDPKATPKCFRDIMLVSRDGLSCVLSKAYQLVFDKWPRISETSRAQLVWLTREMVKDSMTGVDTLCLGLLRQIIGGDISAKNIWLAESMLDIFVENRPWLDKVPQLLATVVYTYLRIIVDHGSSAFLMLRQREVELCVSLLREKWAECMQIGRDLLRLLQNVARIPEFEKLWRDIFLNPTALCPNFAGIMQLMQIRTSRRYLISRLTPDMEGKLIFLISKVKFGQQKRYQDWFQRQYLSTPESQSLRCDLIRYICAVFHPSNDLLCSDIIPRWAVIGWLLTTCTSNVAASDAKLALFYDWLVFEPERDSIMNIEPAILVMFHSMRPHPAITATLLDFMCRIMNNFCPQHATAVKQGVYTSLRTILDKRVIPSLSPLFDNPKLDKELRILLRENFPEFCSQDVKEEPGVREGGIVDNGNNHISDGILSEGRFSDDEDDDSMGKRSEEIAFRPIPEAPVMQNVNITEHLDQLPRDLRDLTVELQNETNQEVMCDLTDRLMQLVIQEDDFDQEISSSLAVCLCHILSSQFNNNLFPQEVDDETIEDSIGTPVFVIFRFLSQMSEEDPRRQPLLQLLGEMYLRQPRIGYHLLYFLKVSKVSDDKMATYKDFCKSMDSRDLKTCLLEDLRLCQEDDVRLFTYLIPDMYTHFPTLAVGNAELLHMIVGSIDGTQLQDLICQILQGHLVMFKNRETFLSILNESLEWESIEQYFLWQLIMAHNIPTEHILPVLPKLEYSTNAEALTCLMVMLKQESPTPELLRPVLCRECKKSDYFVVSVLKYWAQEHEERLAELINSQLTRVNGATHQKKRQKPGTKKDQPSVDQVLAHLDHMRQVCRNISFLNHESVQHALQQVQATATDSLKSKYSDLLALAEDIEDVKTIRVLRGRKMANASPKSQKNRRTVTEDSESNSDSSEDEALKQPPKKRKKTTPNLDEDSD